MGPYRWISMIFGNPYIHTYADSEVVKPFPGWKRWMIGK